MDAFVLANGKFSSSKQRSNTLSDPSSIPSACSTDERLCVVEPKPNRPLGFQINRFHSPPFTICQIEKNSPANKAGLQVHDTLVSINGQSVLQSNYEQIMQTIADARQENFIQFLVSQSPTQKQSLTTKGNTFSWFTSDNDDSELTTRHRNILQQHQSNYRSLSLSREREKEIVCKLG